jgi:hypothetical protein
LRTACCASRAQATAASAEFRTAGRLGEVTFEGAQASVKVDEAATGTITLRTKDGSITVGVAAGVSATLGRVSNALVNAGTPGLTIHATTSRGDITARSL